MRQRGNKKQQTALILLHFNNDFIHSELFRRLASAYLVHQIKPSFPYFLHQIGFRCVNTSKSTAAGFYSDFLGYYCNFVACLFHKI